MKERDKKDFKIPKDLPRQILPDGAKGMLTFEPFEANGNKYFFIRPGDPIGIEKWTQYEKLKIAFGTSYTFEGLVRSYDEIIKLAGANRDLAEVRTEIILLVDSMRKGIIDQSRDRYHKAFYLCSIFIYREGDDPYKWDINTAGDYISDWLAEPINEQDLFFFAMLLTPAFNKIFQDLLEEARKQAERLSVVTGSN